MSTISKDIALQVSYAYREIETAEDLLEKVVAAMNRREQPDIRDAFGRRAGGLQLGVPSGDSSHRLYDVPWALARPIIETHIAQQKAIIAALSERARIEASE